MLELADAPNSRIDGYTFSTTAALVHLPFVCPSLRVIRIQDGSTELEDQEYNFIREQLRQTGCTATVELERLPEVHVRAVAGGQGGSRGD